MTSATRQSSLFLKGLMDTDLQQDLLAEQELFLDKYLRIATARETAKRSQDIINTLTQSVEGISAYKQEQKKITIPKDCCTGCGKKKHTDQATCPAKDTVCPCGRTGHYKKLCFNKGKPRRIKIKDVKEKKETETETGNSLTDKCFNIKN